ncbi:MAG: ATP-binding protein, partial [Microcystaceae cyanobacterium]
SQGKDTQGTLTLKAETQGNQVLITVADDGRGINLEKIRQKALALGILSEKEAKTNQPDRILDCLFAPGFSTATQVSDLSGRGLGLDIVKHLIESLRGTIKLETEAGKGSRFIIRIPLSLNILPLLLVRSQQRVIAFPSQSILRILPLKDASIVNHRLEWEGQKLPLRSIDDLLPYRSSTATVNRSGQGNNPVGLMVSVEGLTVVVSVEQIVDERPLVVKALDPVTPLPPYVAGCTVLGTGEVVAIFAPENFEKLWEPFLHPERITFTGEEDKVKPKVVEKATILIVDDSITVRRTLDRVLSRSGYEVIQCRDGKEAWDFLNRRKEAIALAISDLEMPNMDGFSL